MSIENIFYRIYFDIIDKRDKVRLSVFYSKKSNVCEKSVKKSPQRWNETAEGTKKRRQESLSSRRTLRWMGMAKARVRRSEMDWVI